MNKSFLIITILFFYTSLVKSETSGFTKEFFDEPPPREDTTTFDSIDENIVEKNLHPLRRYDLNKYLIIGTVLELTSEKRSLAIIRTPDATNHIVFIDDVLSKDQPPWIIKKIDLRGITVQKEDAEELDENGNPVYLEEQIDVNNSSINVSAMDKI